MDERVREWLPRLPPHMVRRPRLTARLDGAGPLAVLVGPYGIGRRTAIAEWLLTLDLSRVLPVWVTLARGDTTASVWTAVEGRLDALGVPALSGTADGLAALDRVRRRVAADPRPLLLVLDRYTAGRVTGLAADLVALLRGPGAARVVVTALTVPDVVEVVRPHAEVTVVDPEELAFTVEEVAELCRAHDVAPASAEAVHDALGGWPAPTQTLLAERGGDGSGGAWAPDEERTRSLLVELALDSAGVAHPDLPEAMLRTAVVEDATAELVELLVDDPRVREAWDVTMRVDGHGPWVLDGVTRTRHPALVRQALLDELDVRHPGLRADLHLRAARHFADRGDWLAAAEQASEGGDHERVAALLSEHWAELTTRFPLSGLPWLTRLPAAEIARSPWLAVARDFASMAVAELRTPSTTLRLERRGDLTRMPIRDLVVRASGQVLTLRYTNDLGLLAELLEELDELFARRAAELSAQVEPELTTMMRTQTGVARVYLGDLEGGMDDLRSAYRAGADSLLGYLAGDVAGHAAFVRALTGDLRGAEEWVELAGGMSPPPEALAGVFERWDLWAQALVADERGDGGAAAAAMGRYVPAAAHDEGWAWEAYVCARIGLGGTDRYAAHVALTQARDRARAAVDLRSLAVAMLTSVEVELLLALGREPQAAALLAAAQHPVLMLPRARHALLVGDAASARTHALAGLADDLAASVHRIDLHLVLAGAELELGSRTEALRAVQVAVGLAREGAALRPFARAPWPVLDELLGGVVGGTALADRVAGLPRTFPRRLRSTGLSPREIEVLAELTRTHSHRLIAGRLYVSVNTVKTHVRSIYRKLDVGSRAAALDAATELGLLEPLPRQADE